MSIASKLFWIASYSWGFPRGTSGKEPACQCRGCKRRGFDPWVGRIPWRIPWMGCLASYSPLGHKESDTTEGTQHSTQAMGTWEQRRDEAKWQTYLVLNRFWCVTRYQKLYINWYSHYGEQYRDFLKKSGMKLPYDPAIPLLGIYPKENITQKTHAPQCSLQHYLQ